MGSAYGDDSARRVVCVNSSSVVWYACMASVGEIISVDGWKVEQPGFQFSSSLLHYIIKHYGSKIRRQMSIHRLDVYCSGSVLARLPASLSCLPSSASRFCTLLWSACFVGSKTYIGHSQPIVRLTMTGNFRHMACGMGMRMLVSWRYFSYSGQPSPFS
jgi:hypothetical protein